MVPPWKNWLGIDANKGFNNWSFDLPKDVAAKHPPQSPEKKASVSNTLTYICAIQMCVWRGHQPGLATISIRSMWGLLAATANARQPPTLSPIRYIGLFGDSLYSDLTVPSTNFTSSTVEVEKWDFRH